MIIHRTTLRAANGISMTGFIHPKTNVHYCIKCILEEEKSPYEDMPEDLRISQRY
ncbi:MAG: hypothetical protein ACFFEY_19615 [Candidatus Thorarchaeota archaeon]